MISENTFAAVQSKVYARELDLLVVAGKTEPIRVYELIGIVDEGIAPVKQQFIEIYNSALKLYRQRDWDGAVRGFEKALSIFPDDFPSQLYIERSRFYKSSPPPSDWNGVFFLRTK
jgi:adenylate cyclase